MKKTLILAAVLFVVYSGFSQTTRFVKPTASGTGNGTSWSNASADLQAMIYASNSGDQVFVAAGIYQPAIGQSFEMKEGVKIYGHFAGTESSLVQRNLSGVDTSFLEANGAYVMYNNAGINPDAILDGFCLRNAFRLNVNGACIYNDHASPTIKNCIFYNNETDNGGGAIMNDQCAPIISHCIFRNNTAVAGGAVFNYISNAKFLNCLFYDNYSSGSGGAVSNHTSYPSFINCTIVHNQAIQGSAINNYIPANTPNTQPVIITNCIVWDNFGSPDSVINNDGSFPTTIVTYSNTQVPFAGTGNMSADPNFVNAAGGNYQLNINSPCINAGNSSAASSQGIAKDLSGTSRIQGCDVEMGTYEFYQSTIHKIFVKPSASGLANGSDWANATSNLQAAINLSCSGDSVFVAAGNYQPANGQSFKMKEGVKIYGHFAATESTLPERNLFSADTSFLSGNGNVVVLNNSNNLSNASLINGFTLRNGVSGTGGGILNTNSSPVIEWCIFENNNGGGGGGGVYNDGTGHPVIRYCIFRNNYAFFGGAIYQLSNGIDILNCLIYNNGTLGGNGGAIMNYGECLIVNNTITQNHAQSRGGALTNLGNLTIKNSIMWNNTASISDPEIQQVDGTIDVSYSNVQGGFTGTNNVDENPIFENPNEGNFNLTACSKLEHLFGNNQFVNQSGIYLDLLGHARIKFGTVDMGAFEYEFFQGNRFVKQTASGSGDGISWANATDDLQNAINLSCDGDTVLVAGGIYQPAYGKSFSMKEGVKIYGHFAGHETSINERDFTSSNTSFLKGNQATVVRNYQNGLTNAAVLDGFTIMDGIGTGGSNFLSGGGMANTVASPKINHVVFINNIATDGGGMYNSSSSLPLITNSVFANNIGSGMTNVSTSPVIFNTVFANNIGRGMDNGLYSHPDIFNCTFVNNNAGGMINSQESSPIIINSIMWDYGTEIVTNNSIPAQIYSSFIKGSYTSGGYIDQYPQFLDTINLIGQDGMWMTADDGLNLTPCSPAINMGNDFYFHFENPTDITDSPRPKNTYVDIGAYESPYLPAISLNNLGYGTLSQAVSAAAQIGGTVEIGPCAIESPSITIPMNVLLNIALGGSLTIVP